MKQIIFSVIFFIDIIFIALIPKLASEAYTRGGATLDYVMPYISSLICFLTIGILVGVLCIKKICEKLE